MEQMQEDERWQLSAEAIYASKAGNPTTNAEDDVYDRTGTARVNAELVRLDLDQEFRWPRQTLLWAFLLRAMQTLLYIHACTVRYCLKTVPRAASSSLGQSKKSNTTVRQHNALRCKGAMLQMISSWFLTTWSWPVSAQPRSTS